MNLYTGAGLVKAEEALSWLLVHLKNLQASDEASLKKIKHTLTTEADLPSRPKQVLTTQLRAVTYRINSLSWILSRRRPWVRVNTREPEIKDTKPDVSMLVGTHTGKRLDMRGTCEKCGTPTNWVVDVMGRVGAYWCGCGN